MEVDPQEGGSNNSQEAKNKNDSQNNTSPPSSAKSKCMISKRQLEMKIRSIAVYERREYSRHCWYVNDKVLEEYKLTDLPVPTDWVWLTRPNNNAEKDGKSGTPKSGRETPKLKSGSTTPPPPPVPSIKQFTVTVDPSKLHAPIPQKPTPSPATPKTEVAPATPSSQAKTPLTGETPKRQKTPQHVNPLTLFKNMKPPVKKVTQNGAQDGTSKLAPAVETISKTTVKCGKPAQVKLKASALVSSVECPIVLDDDSGDCMIVEESQPKLPEKPPKNQPSVMSMFAKK